MEAINPSILSERTYLPSNCSLKKKKQNQQKNLTAKNIQHMDSINRGKICL